MNLSLAQVFSLKEISMDDSSGIINGYTTPKSLLKMGMCLCENCGHLISVDSKICGKCNTVEVVTMVQQSKGQIKKDL